MPERAASPHSPLSRLLLPALRWDTEAGWAPSRTVIEEGLELGVGGFILFGGEAAAVRELAVELQERSPHRLLIASDLERGAGQQFSGATPLPPVAALASLDDETVIRQAGNLTAREARALGVNWVYAPVADLDVEPENPIIGTRSFGSDPTEVGRMVAAWVRGCTEGGALSCAKHFPGHGRTVGDSHIERPTVDASAETLEADLEPFRAAFAAGVDSVMTAHVAYPAFEREIVPATLSRAILGDLLRGRLGFDGLVVTDALIMEGFVEGMDEARGAVAAMRAGCDVLLYPQDSGAIVQALARALDDGELPASRVEEALARIDAAASRVAGIPDDVVGREEDRRWALQTAVRTLRVSRGEPRLAEGRVRLHEIEDDAGGPYPPYPRNALPAALRRNGVELGDEGAALVAVYSDIRAWKGRPGISAAAREGLAAISEREPDATVILFSHPRLAEELPTARHLLSAWGGEALMQEAVAAWLTGALDVLAPTASGLDR